MITLLYLTYMTFYMIAFGSLAQFLWGISHPTAIIVIGFTSLAYATKIVGEIVLARKRQEYLQVIQAEYEKQQTSVFTGKGSN